MKWFRLYSEARYDAKLRSLTAEQFRVWFNLLCFASDQPTRGVIESMNDRVLAFAVAEGDVALLNQTVEALVALQCVTSVTRPVTDAPGAAERRTITFINFDKRQYAVEGGPAKSSAERVRRYRERKQLQKQLPPPTPGTPLTPVTPAVTPVTSPEDRVQNPDGEPPRPPTGGTCLSVAVSDPGEAASAVDRPAPVANDPAEVARVEAKAERLFPMLWFGTKVRGLAGDYPMAWVERALEDTHAAGVRDWRYALGILRRLARDGGPTDPTAPAVRAAARDPELAVHRASPRRAAEIEATYRPRPAAAPRRARA